VPAKIFKKGIDKQNKISIIEDERGRTPHKPKGETLWK
jgi:hypothetical protein